MNGQGTYDGRNGPHVFGTPGNQVYIRGQNEGPYNVPGVAGTFQNSPGQGQHVFTDEQGNTYVHQRGGAGKQSSHSISGPGLVAQRGPSVQPQEGGASYNARARRDLVVTRPDRTVLQGPGGTYVGRSRRGLVVSRPDRTVLQGPAGTYVSRQSRSAPADFKLTLGPDNVVRYGRKRRSPELIRMPPFFHEPPFGAKERRSRIPDPQFHISRPDRTVDYGSDGSFIAKRHRRSPQRVQGENFVARGDQAGIWNDEVSVWKRPDGRTVTVDKNGNVITSGSPNGRGPQYVSTRFQYYKVFAN